jgi:hypothetical protein
VHDAAILICDFDTLVQLEITAKTRVAGGLFVAVPGLFAGAGAEGREEYR